MASSDRVQLDLNAPGFLDDFLKLGPKDSAAIVRTLRKLRSMTWAEVYRDHGLKWESIRSRREEGLCSFRVAQGFRAVAKREGHWLRLAALHPDHDGAYGKK